MLPSCVKYNLTAEFSDIYITIIPDIHGTIVFLIQVECLQYCSQKDITTKGKPIFIFSFIGGRL